MKSDRFLVACYWRLAAGRWLLAPGSLFLAAGPSLFFVFEILLNSLNEII